MSFLAQLRNKSTAKPERAGLKLSYLFELDRGAIQLRLALAELTAVGIREIKQPYEIQRHHLVTPPPFMDAADIPLLKELLDMGQESESLTWQFTHKVIDTQRAFIQFEKPSWVRLKIGEAQRVPLQWHVDSEGNQSLRWQTHEPEFEVSLGSQPALLHEDGTLSTIEQADHVQVFLSQNLPPEQISSFVQQNLIQLKSLDIPAPQQFEIVELTERPTVILEAESRSAKDSMQLVWRYQNDAFETSIPYGKFLGDEPQDFRWLTGNRVIRLVGPFNEQHAVYESVREHFKGFEELQPAVWTARKKTIWRKWFLEQQKSLKRKNIDLIIHPSFRHHYVQVDQWGVDVESKSGQLLLQLQCFADDHKLDARKILAQLREEGKRIGDGKMELEYQGMILVLPESLCGILMEEFADLLQWNQFDRGIPKSQISRLQRLVEFVPPETLYFDDETQDYLQRFQEPPPVIDVSRCQVNATLRSYQWLGVCWIQHLKGLGLNGLLADDMGLGKTLQTLAHLSMEHANHGLSKPALIVAPTSLLNNWASELKRFCPQLKSVIFRGADRHKYWANVNRYQVCITSYQLAVNDQEFWQEVPLSWLILDEAQVIKNPKTQACKAVKTFTAQHKLCLSGTPVENHLAELWSIMDFLVPGLLGSLKQFRDYFQKPIEQDRSEERMAQLSSRIDQFILRRTKLQVASDLPPKTVMVKSIELSEAQEEYYWSVKEESMQELQRAMEDETNDGTKQIQLLSAITRLRQACCDPLLLGEESIPSAKTSTCVSMVEELVDEGRAVLVFSQFTRVLDILERELDQLGIAYFTLTGQTKNRAELVERFQSQERPVFLISLKAGGVGLNLTRADTVIHFDPWWNSAAEEQASDRAHRIGQTQPVFVYKLIAQNTIEEKIARMQELKANLSSHINQQAQFASENFALKLDDLMQLWHEA